MKLQNIVIILFAGLGSCNTIETHESLDNATKSLIQSLGLLDQDEKIIQFYSNYQDDLAGNFYTNKRIAHYWLDEHNQSNNDTFYAFYKDIVSIDTIFKVRTLYAPYMLVKKNNGTEFKVFIDGDRQSMTAFYLGALKLWKKHKKQAD